MPPIFCRRVRKETANRASAIRLFWVKTALINLLKKGPNEVSYFKRMDTLFEGQRESNVAMQDLLARVLEVQPAGLSYLRVVSADKQVEGRIYFQDGRRIIGASLVESPLSGYEALRAALQVDFNTFALIGIGHGQSLGGQTALRVDALALLRRLDDLPADISELSVAEGPENGTGGYPNLQVGINVDEHSDDQPAISRISDVVKDAEMSSELQELLNQRMVKTSAPDKPPASNQVKAFSKARKFEARKGLRQALLVSSALVAIICGGAFLYKQFGSNIQMPPKKILSSTIRPRSEVSSIKMHPANSGSNAKRTEGTTLDAKQRTSTQRRRF
ncbi:MAG: hypothetical protein C5B53_06595 [Candidatus Melainabacteria bacterium]|nr:MAG: hypothetical protein C5B53_06595 [Candidatus Melainabacteria bacterium]